MSAVQQLSLTAVEESDLTQADHQTLGSDAHLDFMLTDFIPKSRFELAPEFVDVNPVAGSPGILARRMATSSRCIARDARSSKKARADCLASPLNRMRFLQSCFGPRWLPKRQEKGQQRPALSPLKTRGAPPPRTAPLPSFEVNR
jgi:hypothetical protein